MGLVVTCHALFYAALASGLGAAVYALTRLLALVIVLRDTSPEQRPELVRALAEMYRPASTRRSADALVHAPVDHVVGAGDVRRPS